MKSLALGRVVAITLLTTGGPVMAGVAHWMIAKTLRRLNRIDEALAIQLDLEAQFKEAGKTDPYVYEELASLYEQKADAAKTAHYRELHRKAGGS